VALVTDGYYSFLIYNYGRMSWPNSYVKKLYLAGWNSGDNLNYFQFNASINVLNKPSKWIFRVDYKENIQAADLFIPFGTRLNDTLIAKSDSSHSEIIDTSDNNIRISHNHLLTSICINKNGFVSLNVPYLTHQGINKFPLKDTISMIGPFWANINLTLNGDVYYRIVDDEESLKLIENDVKLITDHFQTLWALVVTWYQVVPVDLNDKQYNNTFQLILTFDSNDYLYAIFNYDQMNSLVNLEKTNYAIGFSLELKDFNLNKNNFVQNSNVNKPGKYVFNLFKPSDYTKTHAKTTTSFNYNSDELSSSNTTDINKIFIIIIVLIAINSILNSVYWMRYCMKKRRNYSREMSILFKQDEHVQDSDRAELIQNGNSRI